MDNPETLVTMDTQDTKTQHRNTKKMSNTDPTKNRGWTQGPTKG